MQTGKISDTCFGGISPRCCYYWMNTYFPTTFVSPHQSDYCPTCRKMGMQMTSLKQSLLMLAVSEFMV